MLDFDLHIVFKSRLASNFQTRYNCSAYDYINYLESNFTNPRLFNFSYFGQDEVILNEPITSFENLEKAAASLSLLTQAVSLASSWIKLRKNLLYSAIGELDNSSQIANQISSLKGKFTSLVNEGACTNFEIDDVESDKTLKRRGSLHKAESITRKEENSILAICKVCLAEIDAFNEEFVIFDVFCREGIKERHWRKIEQVVDQDFTGRLNSINMNDIISLKLNEHIEELKKISDTAYNVCCLNSF